NMSAKYNITFSEQDYDRFRLTEEFGVPMQNLRQLLSLSKDQVTDSMQKGIPVDSTEDSSNELYHWVQQARLATITVERDREANDPRYKAKGAMKIAINADAEEKYPIINLIIETLRNQKQNKFSF